MPAPAGPPAAVRRAADWLLVLTAASLPLSTTGMQLGAGLLFALALVGVPLGWGVARRTPLDGALAIFFGTLAVSTLASLRPLEAVGWQRPWVVIGYFAVFWWLRDGRQAVRVVQVVVGAAALVALYAAVQRFAGQDLYRALLGRATQVRARAAGASGYAVVGFFRSYLTFGHAMVIPLAWAVALAHRGRRIALVAVPLLVVAIVFSTARGAWLAAGAAVLACEALVLRRGVRPGRAAAAALVALVVAAVFSPDLREHARSIVDPGGINAGRVAIYRANLDIVADHPVLGLGFGRYRTAATAYYARHPAADRRSHAHNTYLQIAAEAGLVGLAAFGFLFATVLLRGRDALGVRDDGGAAAAGAWAGVVGFLVGGLTQYNLGDNEVALGTWVALAVLMRLRAEA